MDDGKKFFEASDGQVTIKIQPDKEFFIKNCINEIGFKNFTPTEMDVFFGLCSVFANTPNKEYTLDLTDLRSALKKKKYTNNQIYNVIDRMTDRLTESRKFKDESGTVVKGSLFVISYKDGERIDQIEVSVHEKLRYILNELQKNFTIIQLQEFLTVKKAYTKKLFLLLKQFESTGIVAIKIDSFRKCMGIDEKTENRRIIQDIIKPSVAELEKLGIFPELEYDRIVDRRKPGYPVTGYTFKWVPKGRIIEQKNKETDKKQIITKKNNFNNYEQRQTDYDALIEGREE